MAFKKKTLLDLRSPRLGFLWLGAIVSSAIPMTIAAIMLWPYINYIKWGCKSGSATGRCLQYWPDRNSPDLWEFPVGFTCLIFTPIVCWICCRYVLRRIEQSDLSFGDLTKFTVVTSLKWQAIAGVLHFALMGLLSWKGLFELNQLVYAPLIILVALIAHFLIAIFITVPLSLICVSVFRVIALKKAK